MGKTLDLFDVTPYKPHRGSGVNSLSPRVRTALHRLKETIDAVPREEWEARRRRCQEYEQQRRTRR